VVQGQGNVSAVRRAVKARPVRILSAMGRLAIVALCWSFVEDKEFSIIL
jgi:hypothetical protein